MRSHDRVMMKFAAAFALALGMIAAAAAADLPDPADIDHAPARPATTAPGAPASDSVADQMRSVQGYGARNPLCLAWNDGCVTCRVGDSGPVCANPGPACVPKDEIACTQTKEPEKPAPSEPAK